MADFKSLKNPDLIQAFHLVQYDPTPERQGEFMQEVVKARYLTAASFNPEPDVDEEGNLKFSEDATISFPDIHNDKGEKFFPAFSDWKSMQKWELREGQHVVGMTFDDYAGMVLQDKDAAGFVINPFGENIRIARQVITALKQQQAAYLKRQQLTYERNHPEQAASNAPMEFHELSSYPEKMLEEITEFLKQQPVKKAYMQGVIQGDRKGCMFVLEHQGKDEAIFGGIARIAQPYMQGMYLYMATPVSDLGQKAIEGLEPFYEL